MERGLSMTHTHGSLPVMWSDHVSLVSKLGQSLQNKSREQAQPPDGQGPTGGPTVGAGLRDLTSAIHS